jgi:hypothetical protein
MKKLFFYPLLSGSIVVLMTLLLPLQAQSLSAGNFSSLQQEKLKEIARMIWDKKPEAQILKVWETFVEKEKRSKPDFQDAIKIIFTEVKAIADKNVKIAQEKIRQAQILKLEVDREVGNIRNLRLQYEKSNSYKPVKRKKLEFSKENPPKAIIKEAGYISNINELSEYEDYLQWAGKEANLQGTGGVALLEYAKDAIQTATSNISGTGTQAQQMKKIVERKMSSQ